MTSSTGKLIIAIQILSIISGSGGNQTMVWSVNRIWHKKNFSWKIIQNVVEKLVSYFFLKIKIEQICESTVWNFIQNAFIVCPIRGPPNYIETNVLTGALAWFEAFLKNKRRSGTSLPAPFFAWLKYLKKKISF